MVCWPMRELLKNNDLNMIAFTELGDNKDLVKLLERCQKGSFLAKNEALEQVHEIILSAFLRAKKTRDEESVK